jgi:hypothetical protein
MKDSPDPLAYALATCTYHHVGPLKNTLLYFDRLYSRLYCRFLIPRVS